MKLSKENRRLSHKLFQASFTDGRLDQSKVRTVSNQIASSKPRHYVELLKEYHRLLRLEIEKRHAVVDSAVEFDEGTKSQLEQTLRARYGSDLTMEFKVVPELIGGLRIKIGNDVLDSSVRERLRRLEANLVSA